MKINIYIPELFKNGELIIGGVQTYLFSLIDLFTSLNYTFQIITIGENYKEVLINDGIIVICLNKSDWVNNRVRSSKSDVSISLLAHYSPKKLKGKSVGIQHGVYWDRPLSNKFISNKFDIINTFINLYRSYKFSKKSLNFDRLVCVDTIFPSVCSTIFSPLPWEKIDYIPNFSPTIENKFYEIKKISEIVFSRRLVEHRGSKLIVKLIKSLRKDQIDIPFKIFGKGPDKNYILNELKGEINVSVSNLSYNSRFNAFNQTSLVLIPTLSTEGTSLSCIEAMASGSTIITTCVGGLSNLIIDNHNGYLTKPTFENLDKTIKEILKKDINEINRIRMNSFNSFRNTFSIESWKEKWINILKDL